MLERGMRKFNSVGQAEKFLDAHAAVSNLFNLGRPLARTQHYRDLRISDGGSVDDGCRDDPLYASYAHIPRVVTTGIASLPLWHYMHKKWYTYKRL